MVSEPGHQVYEGTQAVGREHRHQTQPATSIHSPGGHLNEVPRQGLALSEGHTGGSATVPPSSMSACTTNLQHALGGRAGHEQGQILRQFGIEWAGFHCCRAQ